MGLVLIAAFVLIVIGVALRMRAGGSIVSWSTPNTLRLCAVLSLAWAFAAALWAISEVSGRWFRINSGQVSSAGVFTATALISSLLLRKRLRRCPDGTEPEK